MRVTSSTRRTIPIRAAIAASLLAFAALALAGTVPGSASAHPLGNFTINHYAGLRVAIDHVQLDVVIDRAEIPTFQERQRIDTDGDGQVSDQEIEAERQVACGALAADLTLTEAGQPLSLTVQAAGLSFPPGAAGLQTMRLTCEYDARLPGVLGPNTAFTYMDGSNSGRIGWREIVVVGDGAMVNGAPRVVGVSNRLIAYPSDLLSVPLDDRTAAFSATIGGQALPALCISEAHALVPGPSDAGFGCDSAATGAGSNAAGSNAAGSPRPAAGHAAGPQASSASAGAQAATRTPVAAVPGGVGGEISDLLETRDLTPIVFALSLLAAAALGGFHALTPGHGKTVLAAYLVGTRGTARHAIGLGLSVTVSHTIGVALLAVLIIAAGNVIPADQYQHVVAVISGLMIVAIGTWLLAGRFRTWRSAQAVARATAHEHLHEDLHVDHADQDDHHAGDHEHGHVHAPSHKHRDGDDPDQEHEHGGRRHRHLPPPGRELSWRSLFALGLSGGIVPSSSALIILLATITSGRAGYGLVLVVAFGLGMAAVLSGVGLALVYARSLVERVPRTRSVRRLGAAVPVLTAALVFGLGIVLTGSALLGRSLTG
jgi:nickel/cobalt exporter